MSRCNLAMLYAMIKLGIDSLCLKVATYSCFLHFNILATDSFCILSQKLRNQK